MNRTTLFGASGAASILGRMSPAERAAGRYMRDGTGHPNIGNKTVAELALDIKTELAKSVDKVRELAEQAVADAKSGLSLTEKAKEVADEALLKMTGLQTQFDEMVQKADRERNDRTELHKSLGEQFTDAEKVKDFLGQASPRGRVDFSAKAAITTLTTDAAGSVGDAIQANRQPGIQPLPQRRLTIRDLLTPGKMDGQILEYVKETGFTNNAGMVAEGAAKPQSDIKFELVSTQAKVIAHYFKASRQALSDVAQLQSIINQRGLYGLAYKEEQQILFGDGTGQNLLGIVPQATAYSAPFVIDGATNIDYLRLAMLQAALAEYPATGHVMNPIDWARIETEKDGTGRYIIGNPQDRLTPTLWGLPVLETPAMTVDKFLTGAFRLGAQLFDRWEARVEIATENEDDFIKNMITTLVEERVALAVNRPESFIYGDFGNVP